MTINRVHTPYDGSATPFAIGLKPLDLATWIEIDGHYEAYLAEKRRLYAELPDRVLVAEPDTGEAQREVFDLVRGALVAGFPALFPTTRQWEAALAALDAVGEPHDDLAALKAASLLVQEDLVLMRKGPDGWRLAAASLCFPSSWTLSEKFGLALEDIHRPVPGFGRGTRMATLIARIFDNLKPDQPVERMNWSLQTDPALYKPLSSLQRDERATTRPSRFTGANPLAAGFIRVERQTLRRLPASGDILFTIRIFLDPLRVIENHPDRARVAAGFATQLRGLDASQLDYKGLTADRDRLVLALDTLAGTRG